ncbi:hypothetical protein V8F33_012010 [Rhypophila sp. PSN 637]
MRRPIGFRKAPPASAGWSMIEQIADVNFNTPRSPTRTNMKGSRMTSGATSPTSTTSSARSSLSKRDTGFPEGFCGNRNTSLPHPNANLSPDACITEDDIAITRALARHRMSFIAQKEKQHRLNNQHNGALNRGMALNAIEEKESKSSTTSSSKGGFLAGGRDPSFSTVGRLALSSLHGAEFRRHLRRPGSNGTNASDDSHGTVMTLADSVFSEGEEHEESRSSVASSAPSSPSHLPAAYGVGELTRSPDMMTTGLLEKSKTVGGEGVRRTNDPRDEKMDPRDGRIPIAGFERTSGNGVKKSTWIRRLLHR